jgi:hypothetical protein
LSFTKNSRTNSSRSSFCSRRLSWSDRFQQASHRFLGTSNFKPRSSGRSFSASMRWTCLELFNTERLLCQIPAASSSKLSCRFGSRCCESDQPSSHSFRSDASSLC